MCCVIFISEVTDISPGNLDSNLCLIQPDIPYDAYEMHSALICRAHHVKCQAEAQAGIKIAGRNINNLRYAEDTTLGHRVKGTKKPLDESERGE